MVERAVDNRMDGNSTEERVQTPLHSITHLYTRVIFVGDLSEPLKIHQRARDQVKLAESILWGRRT